MIRPFTCVCAILAGASGLYLYSEKHRTTLLDEQISRVVADTEHTRERTAMLRAEWALLNQPDRLQGLATRFLPQLGPMAPTQFVQLASLDKRLPAPGPETPTHPIATPTTAPGLIGQTPQAPGAADPGMRAPGAAPGDAVAIAQADQADQRVRAAPPRPGQASPSAAQFADMEQDGATAVVPQAALRRVALHGTPHEAAHRLLAREAAPVRYAALERDTLGHDALGRDRATITAISSTMRPRIIAAASWRPLHASWPAARPATYATPATAPAIGSSLGASYGRPGLPAPVPLSDGN